MGTVPGEQFFVEAEAREIYRALARRVFAFGGGIEAHVSKSQVAFRAGRAFAFAWRPGMYVNSDVPVVASFALGRELSSQRIKEVAHTSTKQWMHHVELRAVADVDDELIRWIEEAYRRITER
ncbi:DUF5655 domain-containing protein [Mycetocola miduiensis]|uniref:DUF5655 domain-containing protein n=1 Tax=Mycetocola miduiensis TaxID=995034 RepID=A0A1I4ZWR6_9MICO|nr:DUF5655 domain-containing protein [Mycetocola miduiensis]SFN54647.1 hypothetical protein SAMN05216219_1144 [Mycetocola miduiensis]